MKNLKHRQKTTVPSNPTTYPVGSYVKTELGYFYITSNTKRYRFISNRVLDSWSPQRIILTSESALVKYRIASKMKFRSGTLIHNISDGKIYLIESNLKRHVTSPDVLERIGAAMKDVVTVSLNEINLHETGEELN